MGVDVKICGLRTGEALDAAIGAGASHYGMVFFPRSPRHITLQDAAQLAAVGRGRIVSVALTVNAGDAEIEAIIKAANPDMLQLHGDESPERTAQIRELAGRPVIKAISVAGEGDAESANAYRHAADLILFDAKPAPGALPGGNGLSFDWRLLQPVAGRMRFMLSGGLDETNVAEAIDRTGAAMVDVSSGVETAPGHKDAALIRQFVAAAKNAHMKEIANG